MFLLVASAYRVLDDLLQVFDPPLVREFPFLLLIWNSLTLFKVVVFSGSSFL